MSATPKAPRKKHLRILSYNIHKGFTSGNRRFVLGEMRSAIRQAHADLVFLQEVLGEHRLHRRRYEDWPAVSQFEFLADTIWPHFAYGKNAVYTAGHHGNAILSKFPIGLWENIDVSTNRIEKRGLLHARIELPGHSSHLHAICIHLGLFEREREEQILRLCERIDSHVPHDHPLLIAGDFNDWRRRITRMLEKKLGVTEAFQATRGAHARTFPSRFPLAHLDRVYFRGMSVKTAEVLTGKPWRDLSDHAALFCELALD